MAPETRSSAKRRRCKASATALTDSMDLLIEILMRLPAKNIFKCKAVSKHWYSIVCHPELNFGDAAFSLCHLMAFGNGVHCNGAIFWYNEERNTLAYFELDTGRFKRSEMPQLALPYPI
ncbi:Hypothetical predicted protein [Prunus dulcis]|uniref:F-box domain-containing protein n=1 Tax=Prunus dulcis TaxID=3755 RepID=A0A5E4FM20_PRUDU|nr:Hypothetical predicted protein [Prunus dulcis]